LGRKAISLYVYPTIAHATSPEEIRLSLESACESSYCEYNIGDNAAAAAVAVVA